MKRTILPIRLMYLFLVVLLILLPAAGPVEAVKKASAAPSARQVSARLPDLETGSSAGQPVAAKSKPQAGAPGSCSPTSLSAGLVTQVAFIGVPDISGHGDMGLYLTSLCSVTDPIKVLDSNGMDLHPSLSADGSWIVFESYRTGNEEIYKVRSNGSSLTRLTTTSVSESDPTFSPDGKQIAYIVRTSSDSNIYLMNSSGASVRRFTRTTYHDYMPAWSPDGKKIAWMRDIGANSYLYVKNADGSGIEKRLATIRKLWHLSWSPDGKQLAFEYSEAGDRQDIGIINADGSGLIRILAGYSTESEGYVDYSFGSWYGVPGEEGLVFLQITYEGTYDGYSVTGVVLGYKPLDGSPGFTEVYTGNVPVARAPHAQTITGSPAFVNIDTLPSQSPSTFDVDVHITDALPGTVFLQAKTDANPEWSDLPFGSAAYKPNANGEAVYTYHFSTQVIHTISFRAYIKDSGSKISCPSPEVSTRIYQWHAQAKVQDARETPISGAVIDAGPYAYDQPVETRDGSAQLYYFDLSHPNQEAAVAKTGFGALPNPLWPVGTESEYLAVLPPQDDLVINGYFEDPAGLLLGWQAGGELPVIAATGRYGGRAAQLGDCYAGSCAPHAEAQEAFLFQLIDLPAEINAPTLSFFYRLEDAAPNDQVDFRLRLTPQNEDPVTLFESASSSENAGWRHAWFDLSPWKGQMVSLAFAVEQVTGQNEANLYLDEVTLGAWVTPTVTALAPARVDWPVGEDVWVEITGENFAYNIQVWFGDQLSPQVNWISANFILCKLPPGLAMGRYALLLENPGGVSNRASQALLVGYATYLPQTRR